MTGRPRCAVSVVIPAYNEEDAIRAVVERVERALDELVREGTGLGAAEILVVNDGSTDRTAERARVSPRVRVITHEHPRGYGAALKTGFRRSRGDIVVFLDADGTYPPERLAALCRPIAEGHADMTVGDRMSGGGGAMPLVRRLGNRIFSRLLSWIVEAPVRDSASGMRAFRRSVLPRLLPLPDGMDFIVGLSTRAHHEGLRVVEIPIPYAERRGRSKLALVGDGLRFLRTFAVVAATYNPLKFFGVLGLLALAVAGYLGLGPVAHYVRYRRVEEGEIYRLFTILVLGIIGLQLVNFGIVGNRLLALVSGLPLERRGVLGRLFLNQAFARVSWRLGAVLCLGAVVLNHRAVAQFLALRAIDLHWSYPITGATMFLVGAQLVMAGSLLAIFRRVEERREYLGALGAEDDELAGAGGDRHGTRGDDREAGGVRPSGLPS